MGCSSLPYQVPTQVALLTKHGKAQQLAPALAPLGIALHVTEAFDTDNLGTFSGEVERTLSPLECAKKKARLACELSGLSAGLGSEGSFGGGPLPGLMNWDTEILVLHDAQRDIDIVATAAGPVNLKTYQGQCLNELEAALKGAGDGQAWILKTQQQITKGIGDINSLKAVLDSQGLCDENSRLRERVDITPDLRAMYSPQRQAYIFQAGQQLAERLQTFCPACGLPDFWLRERVAGLPCSGCGAPTELAKAYIRQCAHCNHQLNELTQPREADPYRCQWCNP
ncbi:DUF6671 family protein [Pseudoalteromonas sp. SSDWG2]|uniref:DUF6671 family protein n=1 Tax=Pseudoalteromonas sp. SSDWG2 TaxID=3139391 RepID=UPI003BA856F4